MFEEAVNEVACFSLDGLLFRLIESILLCLQRLHPENFCYIVDQNGCGERLCVYGKCEKIRCLVRGSTIRKFLLSHSLRRIMVVPGTSTIV
jgi:hypothetical protein